MIHDAALSLLTDTLRASVGVDWFERAAEWSCELVRGEASLLMAAANEPGDPNAYYVHDAITQIIRTGSGSEARWQVPSGIWAIVTEQCSTDTANSVGYAAATAEQSAAARNAWMKGATAGDQIAMYNLGLLLHGEGDTNGAEEWLTRGAEDGGTAAMYGLGILLADTGRAGEAEGWLGKAAAAGDPIGMYNFARLLHEQHQLKRAKRWYEKAANYGIHEAIFGLASILSESDEATDLGAALLWFSRGASLGDAGCAFRAGSLYFEAADRAKAEIYWRQAAEAGLPDGMGMLGYLLVSADPDEAEAWMRRAAEAGHVNSMINLSSLLKMRNRFEESQRWADRWSTAASDQGISPTTQTILQRKPQGGPAGRTRRPPRRK